MTITQIVVIIAGLLFGYRLVSYMLAPGTGDKDRKGDSSPDGREDGSGGGPANQRERRSDWSWSDTPQPPAPETAPPWYQILGVAESASRDEIDRAYRVRISQYHPDKVANLGEEIRRLAEVRSKEINGAYDIACRHGDRGRR